MMLEIVAVGAIATQLELRMPSWAILLRKASQSSVDERSTSTYPPRADASMSSVSIGRMPRSHKEPLKLE